METNFTEGKWTVEESSYHPGLYDQIIKSDKAYVGRLRGNDLETKSNANIISASPDMFEQLVSIIDGTAFDKETGLIWEHRLEEIRKVLNKAVGSDSF